VASRTSGFNVQPIADLAPASVLTLLGLMFIGGSPASTAGGITTGTFSVLVLAASAYVRGADEIRIGRRAISRDSVHKAVAILIISIGVVAVGAWLLMATHKVSFEHALFEAVSAFATCGFSLGVTGSLNGFGRFIVALLMIWGRLGPLTIVVAVTRERRPSPISYPEERILIGEVSIVFSDFLVSTVRHAFYDNPARALPARHNILDRSCVTGGAHRFLPRFGSW